MEVCSFKEQPGMPLDSHAKPTLANWDFLCPKWMPFCFSFRGLFPDTLKKVGLGEVHSPRGKEGRHRKPCPPEPTAFPGALFLAFSGEVAFWMASGGQEPWQTAPSDGGSAMSDSIFNPSNRKRLLIGFIKTLWQEYKASELTHREDLPVEEDVPDDVQVTSLQDCMLRILQDLRSNAEIPSPVCWILWWTGP
ncbi:uncharacterized protein LOC121934264 isoform X3 [Sceloporus undulatus]|uniref:uncharacterized protein LOC121934264 isoform X3 n=1 Tax=Sceloporus undulatus TaxID=8520 RepID=UPI001C4B3FE0|nr:uncharacterized protein LOC121934264 isoform X3 [Sceloporus undulatus]